MTPKIQVDDPSVEYHSIFFPKSSFIIPLLLWGIFSYLPSSKISARILEACGDVYYLTPRRWNPRQYAYSTKEENILDWEGNMVEMRQMKNIV